MNRPAYWESPYCRELSAEVVHVQQNQDGTPMFACNQTIFYPQGGGQPGDIGQWLSSQNQCFPISNTTKSQDGFIWHSSPSGTPSIGQQVKLILNWQRRHHLMRTHSAMHLLSAAVQAPVTGGSIKELQGRLDFDCPTPPVKDDVENQINQWIHSNASVITEWADAETLAKNPQWARAMFAPPPDNAQHVRIVNIVGIDVQACGGTHVQSLKEIGVFKIIKIEKKGRINRRMVFALSQQ